MRSQKNALHLKQVEAWKQKNPDLSSEEMTQLLINAICTIRKRSLQTLSGVTVTAVTDRILIECKEKFPELNEVTSDREGLHFNNFIAQISNYKAEVLHTALQEFLIELLEVLGKITAEILTKYLYVELMSVSIHAAATNPEPHVTSLLSSAKNREKK